MNRLIDLTNQWWKYSTPKELSKNLRTYPFAKFFSNKGFEDIPYNVEDEGLLDHMNLLQSEGHSVLNEGEKAITEGRRKGLSLLHSQTFEIHYNHYTIHLSLWFQDGRFMDQVEDTEDLVCAHFGWIPCS